MNWGLVASIVLGLGVAGHAVVGVILTTPLANTTQRLWSKFGQREALLRLNGILLVVASLLHLLVSWLKVSGSDTAVFVSSVLPFPLFAIAGLLQERGRINWLHHVAMAGGWGAFLWHATVAA